MFTQLRETLARTYTKVGRGVACSLLLFVLFPHLISSKARAEVIISEIMANPDEGTEWIELINTGEDTVTISNYTLYDAVSSPSLILTLPAPTHLENTVPLVLELPSAKLNNSGDTITLYDQNKNVVTSATFSESTKGLSWQLISIQEKTYQEDTPSPGVFSLGLETSPQPSPTPDSTPEVTPKPTVETPPSVTTMPQIFSDAELAKAEENILALTQDYPPTSLSWHKMQQDVTQLPSEPKTKTIPKHFTPAKSSTFCLAVGGILIAVASYCVLYVVEEKNLNSQKN